MSRYSRFAVIYCALIIFAQSSPRYATAQSSVVKFDVPALVGVHEIDRLGDDDQQADKVIEVVIPVTSEIRHQDRGNVSEFRFDVFWNRNAYSIIDYAPKTQSTSNIEGLISVEKKSDNSAGIGINLNSKYQDLITGNGKIDLSQKNGTTLKYQEIPQQQLLVASGTVRRGTGAFFRFHPMKQETLEGGQDLIVAYRVPQSWRGGVLKIECRTHGHRKIFGSWKDRFEESRSFVLPIYLEGDDQARQAAIEFVRTEQGLRRNWYRHQSENSNQKLSRYGFPLLPNETSTGLPKQWLHHLIQSGNDDYLTHYQTRLSKELSQAAQQFVVARKELVAMSR